MLKWDLNAVTVSDFIHELAERLVPILNSARERAKLVEHSLTLANVCLICEFQYCPPPFPLPLFPPPSLSLPLLPSLHLPFLSLSLSSSFFYCLSPFPPLLCLLPSPQTLCFPSSLPLYRPLPSSNHAHYITVFFFLSPQTGISPS